MQDVKQLAAELALLREYDRIRTAARHDFGGGQRGKELGRRQRELESLVAVGGPSAYELERDASREDLLAAFHRIGAPRLKRANGETWRVNTPSSQRTIRCWKTIGNWVGASV